MVANSRQDRIIQILMHKNEWITGKDLSNLLNVSDRTIRSDIEAINQMYKAPLIMSHLRLGYHIIEENINMVVSNNNVNIPITPMERVNYIIKELLFDKNELNLTLLQEQMYVSGYSIENDIKRIRKILKQYDGLNLLRRKNYIYLQGEEKLKRKLYKDLLVEETQGNFLNINKLSEFYQGFDFIKVKDILMIVLDEYNYSVKETMFPMLMMHIGISIERIMHFNFIKTSRKSEELERSLEYQIAKDFYYRVSQVLNIEIVEDEITLLALLLVGNRTMDYSKDNLFKYLEDNKTMQLVEGLFLEINRTFGVDFSKDEDLKLGLITHLQGLIERTKTNQKIDNVFLQDIKKTYPLIFEMAICAIRYLEEQLDIEIGENEAGFIALHLGAGYERMNVNRKYKAIMIIPHDQAFSKLCCDKVNTLFNERMTVVKTLHYFEEKEVLYCQPDILITTVPLIHQLDIETVQIGMFVSNEDESSLFQALNRLDKKRFQLEFTKAISRLIDENYFYLNLDAKTPKEVIEFMCKELENEKIINNDFVEAVLKREEASPTSFNFSFAIPHALGKTSNESKISVALLKNPVKWGNFEVKLVLLLAISEEDHHMLKMFFDWLANAVNDANTFAALLKSKSYEDFMNTILE